MFSFNKYFEVKVFMQQRKGAIMKHLRIHSITTVLVIVLSCQTFSQSQPNSVYFEVLGNGGLYSINYDRLFTENLGGRIGVMYFNADWFAFFNDVDIFLIPITLNYCIGTGKHKLELGAGGVIGLVNAGFFGSNPTSGSGVVWTGTIGYRYQKNNGGFMWRIGFTPLFNSKDFLPWGGISMGYSF